MKGVVRMAWLSKEEDFEQVMPGYWLQDHEAQRHEVVKIPMSQPAFRGDFTLSPRRGKRRKVLRSSRLKITITS